MQASPEVYTFVEVGYLGNGEHKSTFLNYHTSLFLCVWCKNKIFRKNTKQRVKIFSICPTI